MSEGGSKWGLVIRNTGNNYLVRTDDGDDIPCLAKGSFRLKGIRSTSPVVVGDKVRIGTNSEGTAYITEIEDRKNYIVRRASNLSKQAHILAANVILPRTCSRSSSIPFPVSTEVLMLPYPIVE
jgi:ribosome biogenesis GTPase